MFGREGEVVEERHRAEDVGEKRKRKGEIIGKGGGEWEFENQRGGIEIMSYIIVNVSGAFLNLLNITKSLSTCDFIKVKKKM